MNKWICLLGILLGAVACSSRSPSPLRYPTPIVNVESAVANFLVINSTRESVTVENRSDHNVKVAYLLTWYDKNGVTQRKDWQQDEVWQFVNLNAKQQVKLALHRPTAESVNYRIYFKSY